MDVTVRITRDGDVEVTIADDAGYSPDLADDLCRRARQTAVAVHHDVCTASDA